MNSIYYIVYIYYAVNIILWSTKVSSKLNLLIFSFPSKTAQLYNSNSNKNEYSYK